MSANPISEDEGTKKKVYEKGRYHSRGEVLPKPAEGIV